MKNLWYRGTVVIAIGVVVLFGLRTCVSSRGDLTEFGADEAIEAELSLQAVTLEQPDVDGSLLWRLEADSVTYVPETQRADLLGLRGEFYEEGEKIYTVVADEGEVEQNGNTLFLRGNLVATRIEDDLVIEGELLKWQPKQGLLRMGDFESEMMGEGRGSRPPVTISNPTIQAVARSLIVNNKQDRVNMEGGVTARSKSAPWLTFASEALVWLTAQSLIRADQQLIVERFATDSSEIPTETPTDRLVGGSGNAQLDDNIVTVEQSVRLDSQLDSGSEGLSVESDQAVWDVAAQTVELDQPVDIAQPARQLTASANRASVDLAEQIIYLIGNVRANGAKNDTSLAADSVTWRTLSQEVEAEGNVRYQQAANPEAILSGPRAIGNIEDGTLVVIGDGSSDVVTEIVPEGL
ncbi:MAG: LPS export ABC transporter periplasmic protein LptC [Cyanobacteria bacterium P01_D01_bin.1]